MNASYRRLSITDHDGEVMSVFTLWATAQPRANFWTTTTVNFALAYFSISISCEFLTLSKFRYPTDACQVTVFATLLIAARLLWMSGTVKDALGARHARTYTSIAAMMVECAAPYSAAGLIFIGTYSVKHPFQHVALAALTQLVVCDALRNSCVYKI
jgi:hypothetical protein